MVVLTPDVGSFMSRGFYGGAPKRRLMEGKMKLAYYEGVFKELLELCPSEDVRTKATTIKVMENFMERAIAELSATNCTKLREEMGNMKCFTADRIIPIGAKYMLGLVGEYDSRIMEMQAKIDELKACKDVMVSAFGVKYMETFMNDNGETRNKDIMGSSYVGLQTSFAVLCVSYGGGEEFFLKLEKHSADMTTRETLRGEILKELGNASMRG